MDQTLCDTVRSREQHNNLCHIVCSDIWLFFSSFPFSYCKLHSHAVTVSHLDVMELSQGNGAPLDEMKVEMNA